MAGSLFVTYLFGSVVLAVQQVNVWMTAAGWITAAIHLFFALGYGFFWFKGSLMSVPIDARPQAPSGQES